MPPAPKSAPKTETPMASHIPQRLRLKIPNAATETKHSQHHTCIQHDRWARVGARVGGEKDGKPEQQACQNQQDDGNAEHCWKLCFSWIFSLSMKNGTHETMTSHGEKRAHRHGEHVLTARQSFRYVLMRCAIDVIDACGRKGSDLGRSVGELHIDSWCSRLTLGMGSAICVPHPILQDMFCRTVIDDEQFGAFGNQTTFWAKLVAVR